MKTRAKAYFKLHKYIKWDFAEVWTTPIGTETSRAIFTKSELTDEEINAILIERNINSARLLGTNKTYTSLIARALHGI